jgi:toxin ParE1/3/4
VLRLIWNPAARRDLKQVLDYISDRDATAASRLSDSIETCAERLPQHPYLYRPGRISGTREAVVHPNYIMIYEVHADAVEIMAVVHSRQEYPSGE